MVSPLTCNSYQQFLNAWVEKYLSILESIFGPRDSRFVFGTVRSTNKNYPHTGYPDGFHFNGNCRVDIFITADPWKNCRHTQGPWQVAHECVHLLDPVERGFNTVLEEGLAAWFQNEPRYHSEMVRRYIIERVRPWLAKNEGSISAYNEAENLIRNNLPDILDAVKSLRASGVRISKIQADMLARLLPNADRASLKRLGSRFEN